MAKQIWQDAELAVGAMSQPDAGRVFAATRQPAGQIRQAWHGTAGFEHPPTRVTPSRSHLAPPIGAALSIQ